MFRAVFADRLGPAENYGMGNWARAPLRSTEIRVAIAAAGVSFVDILIAGGRYQVKPPTPFIPGSEFSGEVIEVGADVTEFQVGARVAASALGGGFAEEAIVEASVAIPLPSTFDHRSASVSYISYQTAYHALVQRASLKSREILLVLGASGGVGMAAVEIGRALGATVIGSASTLEKRIAATARGAAHTVDATSAAWRDEIKELTGGRGADVVVDPVGGAESERAFRSLAWRGRHLIIGFAAGAVPALRTNLALLKGAALIGVDLRQFRAYEPSVAASNVTALNDLIETRRVTPEITHLFPLERFAEAMALAGSRTHIGRVALDIAHT
jgi:NADPH:quinone reductase